MTLPASLTMPDGTSYLPKVNVPAQFWRVNHDKTMWRQGMPEVFRYEPLHATTLTEPVQWLWRRMCSELTDDQWTLCLGNELALTNKGNGFPGRRNWIKREDMDKEDPKFEQPRFFGGTILKERFIKQDMPYTIDGRVHRGPVLYFEYINVNEPLPMPHEVMNKPWLFCEAVNINKDAQGNFVIRRFKGNWGKPVYVPILASMDVYYPVELCTKLDPGAAVLPSPYQYP